MKKLLICLCATLLLTSCDIDDGMEYRDPNLYRSESDYEEEFYSWEDNYDEGYDEGFIEGYYSGFDEIYNSVHEAEHYALNKGGWHPEEAMAVIEMYQTKISYHPDGSLPTKEEYLDAINSLVAFYEYYYLAEYESLSEPLQ